MKLKNEERWSEYKAKNRDGYGLGIITFAERWADAMEAQIVVGSTVDGCAQSCEQEADTEGITGFMYGC